MYRLFILGCVASSMIADSCISKMEIISIHPDKFDDHYLCLITGMRDANDASVNHFKNWNMHVYCVLDYLYEETVRKYMSRNQNHGQAD